jgi:acetyl-CoA carboxylase carboxyl transferase subunit alpha
MEVDKIKNLPRSFLKDTLKSVFKFEKLKKITGFTGVHFNDAERKLAEQIENYRQVESQALKSWRTVQLSRDENRPHTPDYINGIFDDFISFSGDRQGFDDKSIIAGLGILNGSTVAVIGHNKGRNIKERVEYNFGSSMPQGYRKAARIMEIAQRFGFSLVTFIDTPGAYPALEAEDSGQAGAIARSIYEMFSLDVPTITVLIGEGGSGGALALAIGNFVMMLENSTYSVISPEGCASILWREASAAKLASRALKLTSRDLLKLGVIDKIIYEPMGGAHNNPERIIRVVKSYIKNIMKKYDNLKDFDFKTHRAKKYESIGITAQHVQQKV